MVLDKTIKSLSCKVDWENNAEAFWGAMRDDEELAEVYAAMVKDLEIPITVEQYMRLVELPDWCAKDAPERAPHPLIITVWRG